jgi:hypothetical protein
MTELRKWTRESNYAGDDYSDYYVVGGQHRDSNYEQQSNFIVATQRLGGENPPEVIIVHCRDWLVGWVEFLMVHEDAKDKLELAQQIRNNINEDIILDWDHYQDLKSDEVDDLVKEIKRDIENDIENGETECRQWKCWGISLTDGDERIRQIADEHVM